MDSAQAGIVPVEVIGSPSVPPREWLAQRLAGCSGGLYMADDGRLAADNPEVEAVPAAVLVPLVNRAEGLTLLLTRRTEHLHDHPGQISFPGGRVEAADSGPVDTALRETEEEIGLARAQVHVLGHLPDYRIVTGYRVTPVVGWVEPPFELQADPFEVAEVFEVPLAFMLDPANHQRHRHVWRGRDRHYYAIPFDGRFIWGATAGIILSLHRLLAG